MSSIITGVLNLTFGLLWDKLRDNTAQRLQNGDVTDQKCRQIIVRELDNIQSLLDGLSRKDLLASISFLKEGVCLLNIVFKPDICRCELQENNDIVTDVQSSVQVAGECSSAMSASRSKQNLQKHERFEVAIERLPQIINNFDIACKVRLSSARMAFVDARREATRAFNNKGLPMKDRILACKLRVISRMLESVEDPKAVVDTCMLYLEELHSLEGIQEMFSVHIAGGLKARFNKRTRQDTMSSVIMISYVLAKFTLHFVGRNYNLFNWPKIELKGRSFHPLLDPAANAIMQSAKIGAPNIFLFDRISSNDVSHVDSKISQEYQIMETGSGNIAEIVVEDEEIQFCFFHSLEEISTVSPKILLVVISGEDGVYVVGYVKTSAKEFDFFLIIADKTGKKTHESSLEFLSQAEKTRGGTAPADEIEIFSNRPRHVEFTVNNSSNIFVFGHLTCIYVCDNNGVLLRYFETTDRNDLVCTTINSDVITARYSSNAVYVYSMTGSMVHQFDVLERARGFAT